MRVDAFESPLIRLAEWMVEDSPFREAPSVGRVSAEKDEEVSG